MITPTDRELIEGPLCCSFFACCINSVTKIDKYKLNVNEQILITHEQDTKENRYEFGPKLVALKSPYESYDYSSAAMCEVLDQDDFIVVRSMNGTKRMIKGPCVYEPTYGEVVESRQQSIQIPVNHYMIINDSNNPANPVIHKEGPQKIYLTPYQTVQKSVAKHPASADAGRGKKPPPPSGGSIVSNLGLNTDVQNMSPKVNVSDTIIPCIEITQQRAVHLQLIDGSVVLVSTPQYRTLKVGESVIQYVDRVLMLTTDFCILKAPDGTIEVKDGKNQDDRSFFIKPFYEFVSFECERSETIMSTLPTFMSHGFSVSTKDNVEIQLDLRICYQIQSVENFSAKPIEMFYSSIKDYVQNKLLGRFASSTLREFMNIFANIAESSVDSCSAYFMKFGIEIMDVQILDFRCTNAHTQELLNENIKMSVTKQNELRAAQNDVAIQEQSAEVERKKKDLLVQMNIKDSEVRMQKKELENTIRIKEMDIEIQEEQKRTELLEVRRGNDLMEAEFAGKARGHEFSEFCNGIDENLNPAQKMLIWEKEAELEQAKLVYSKLDTLNMYPPDEDVPIFQFGTNEKVTGLEMGAAEKADIIVNKRK